MTKMISVLILGCACSAVYAAGDAPSGASPLSFQQLDKNRDGFVTRDEAREAILRKEIEFDKLDADGDGKLSEEEMTRPAGDKAVVK